ncbi:hypothetical protein WDZ17_09630 [Pseudokineococcus basanitobsidens]|uniref:Membrane protein YczE n=1 Tax=Pseudokineococcus basanitobsidens TaxID=1926649 RepID=A0ABU8RKC0_9ACTN
MRALRVGLRDRLDRPVPRAARLLLGLVLFALGLAVLVRADLGLDPWTVLSDGLRRVTGLTLGQLTLVTSFVLLLLWFPLRERPGAGTLANAVVVGPVLDLGLLVLPPVEPLALRGGMLVGAVLLVAAGTGLYVGAGWGPGPRDGIMTGLARRGVPLPLARAGIELTVLAVGWSLGGSVGLGTVVFALSIGPLVGLALPRLALDPPPGAAPGRPPGRRRRWRRLPSG